MTPVVTLVILFGSKKWDGPRTLQEMMSTQDSDILRCVADYKINLIEPAAIREDDFGKFHSNLKAVMGFIKYSDDGEELDAFLSSEKGLETLDVEAARVIKACTNTDIEIDEKAEVIDVCKAVREMNEKAAEKARLETLCDAIRNAMDSFHVSVEDAMKALKVDKKDQAALMKMI